MVKDNKGNPTPIQSLGKFEEPNARFGFSLQMNIENSEWFDKKQIALVIRNSTLDDKIGCSLLAGGIVKYCDGCTLKCICNLIDDVREKYIEETTKVINTFNVN